jgi:hypothetical protein
MHYMREGVVKEDAEEAVVRLMSPWSAKTISLRTTTSRRGAQVSVEVFYEPAAGGGVHGNGAC